MARLKSGLLSHAVLPAGGKPWLGAWPADSAGGGSEGADARVVVGGAADQPKANGGRSVTGMKVMYSREYYRVMVPAVGWAISLWATIAQASVMVWTNGYSPTTRPTSTGSSMVSS